MKIISVNDMAADTLFGGAEYNCAAVLAELQAQGHEVEDHGMRHTGDGVTIEAHLPNPQELDADILMLGQFNVIDPRWLLTAMQHSKARVVLWLHTLPWCRNYSGACGGAVDPSHAGCRVPLYWEMIRRADTVLCYSPAQANAALRVFGGLGQFDKYRILPIFCDSAAEFYAHRNDEKAPGSVLSVARHCDAKGALAYCLFAATNAHHLGPFRAVGTYKPGIRERYEQHGIECIDRVPLEDLPAMLGASEYFYHQPPQLDTGPRTIVEARLAGCKLITSCQCGYQGHPLWEMSDEELVARCMTAPKSAAKAVIAGA